MATKSAPKKPAAKKPSNAKPKAPATPKKVKAAVPPQLDNCEDPEDLIGKTIILDKDQKTQTDAVIASVEDYPAYLGIRLYNSEKKEWETEITSVPKAKLNRITTVGW